MWRVLSAELQYNRYVAIYILTLSVLSFISVHFYTPIFGRPMTYTNAGIISSGHMFFFFVGTILVSAWWKERTYRSHVLLPLGAWKIGAVRFGMYLIYWISLLCIYFIWSRISQHFTIDAKMISVLCTQTGFILIVFSLIFFWSDLRESTIKNRTILRMPGKKVFGLATLVTIMLISFISMAGTVHTYQRKCTSQFDRFLCWVYQSETGPVFFIALGLCFAMLTIMTFGRRRSYFD
ncbi:MAG: hypothetical protein JSV84_09060 [Gemmatimonadota bacterium]|nr:MAG: hypothetical protein JSV84_09060 [Gemmatimonadota bacterium]